MENMQFDMDTLVTFRNNLNSIYRCMEESRKSLELMNDTINQVIPREGGESDMFYYISWAYDNTEGYLSETVDKIRLAIESCDKAIKSLKKSGGK